MNCNFTIEYESITKNIRWWIVCLKVTRCVLTCAIFAVTTPLIASMVQHESAFNTSLYLKTMILLIGLYPIIPLRNLYRKYKNKKLEQPAPEFTYKQLIDWYHVNPRRFIFDKNHFGLHYMIETPPNKISKISEFVYERTKDGEQKTDNLENYKYLIPKRFVDYIKYLIFVENLYRKRNKKHKKGQEVRERKKKNKELLEILLAVQSDIQNILNKEENKTGKVISDKN